MSATKLQDILVHEVSGVDDPANELPGWVIVKRRSALRKTMLEADRDLVLAGVEKVAATRCVPFTDILARVLAEMRAEETVKEADAASLFTGPPEPTAAVKATSIFFA